MMRIFIVAIALAMLSVGTTWAEPVREITVTGFGQVETVPDMARISVGVSTERKTALEAMTENATRMTAVLARLAEAGVAQSDMQTRQLTLYPRMDRSGSGRNEPPTVAGYVAGNTLSVRIRDLSTIGPVLDAVLQSGANRFNGLAFSVSDPAQQLGQARRLAVRDARQRAEIYAEAAGVVVGQVISISEPDASRPQPAMRLDAMGAVSDGVPLAAGEVTTSARITVVFAIGDT